MKPMSQNTVNVVARLFARAMQAKNRNDGRPFVLAHHVTNRCMCSCESCLWRRNDWEDVPLEDLKRFYTEAKEEGFVATAMTGGEPFLRKDLGEFVRFVKQDCNMGIGLFTTGWFLHSRMDEVLPHLDIMIVSIDSASATRHDKTRGLSGLFQRATDGVAAAKKKYPKLSIKLNCCIRQGVSAEIDDLLLLTEDLGVNISFDVITEFRHGADGSRSRETSVGLPLPELKEICSKLLEKKRAGAPILNSENYFEYFVKGRPGYRCHLPKITMFIDGRGYLEYCLDLDHPIANIRDMPLKQIMELPRFKQLRADSVHCGSCNSPTMVDMSHVWEKPNVLFESGGVRLS